MHLPRTRCVCRIQRSKSRKNLTPFSVRIKLFVSETGELSKHRRSRSIDGDQPTVEHPPTLEVERKSSFSPKHQEFQRNDALAGLASHDCKQCDRLTQKQQVKDTKLLSFSWFYLYVFTIFLPLPPVRSLQYQSSLSLHYQDIVIASTVTTCGRHQCRPLSL
jgi:hypothetical protein